MRGHLATARGRVRRSADSLQQHLFRSHSEHQTQGAITVVGIEPIVSRPHHHACRGLDRFVPCATDLKVDSILPLEQNFFVVDAAGSVDHPEQAEQVIPRKHNSV